MSAKKRHHRHGRAGTSRDAGDDVQAAFVLPGGPVDLAALPTDSTPVGPRKKSEAKKAMAALAPRLSELQEKLFAQSTAGDPRSVLLLLQGMDTSGKDGVIGHVLGLVDPGGVHLASFKKPTAEELAHDFLWRIEKQVPEPGMIGVFNRSQYEDVLVVRVHDLVPKTVWSKRFAAINAFERDLARRDVTLVKCFLHISRDVQAERLAARLDDQAKYWKYNPADVDERERWPDYQAAYTDVLRKCSTSGTPWYVIPSDRKWYRNWAIAALLTQVLERIDPHFPAADFDVEVERARLAES